MKKKTNDPNASLGKPHKAEKVKPVRFNTTVQGKALRQAQKIQNHE